MTIYTLKYSYILITAYHDEFSYRATNIWLNMFRLQHLYKYTERTLIYLRATLQIYTSLDLGHLQRNLNSKTGSED